MCFFGGYLLIFNTGSNNSFFLKCVFKNADQKNICASIVKDPDPNKKRLDPQHWLGPFFTGSYLLFEFENVPAISRNYLKIDCSRTV